MLTDEERAQEARVLLGTLTASITNRYTAPFPGLALGLYDFVGADYLASVTEELSNLIPEGAKTVDHQKLRKFLAENWALVGNTAFSYLAVPDAPITIFCSGLAELLAANDPDSAVTPISLLMPGVIAEDESLSIGEIVKSLGANVNTAPFQLSSFILCLKKKPFEHPEDYSTFSSILAHFTPAEILVLLSSQKIKILSTNYSNLGAVFHSLISKLALPEITVMVRESQFFSFFCKPYDIYQLFEGLSDKQKTALFDALGKAAVVALITSSKGDDFFTAIHSLTVSQQEIIFDALGVDKLHKILLSSSNPCVKLDIFKPALKKAVLEKFEVSQLSDYIASFADLMKVLPFLQRKRQLELCHMLKKGRLSIYLRTFSRFVTFIDLFVPDLDKDVLCELLSSKNGASFSIPEKIQTIKVKTSLVREATLTEEFFMFKITRALLFKKH